MQPIKNFEAKKTESGVQALPAGGYVAKIIGAEERKYSWGSQLVIAFEIAEGEYKGYFKRKYDANTNEDKKWSGTYRLRIPQEDNQYYSSQKRDFENFVWAIEQSNSGYNWNWNESTLKEKYIGVLFRNKEYDIERNGTHYTGWTTECSRVTDVESIRNGDFRIPKDKPLNKPVNNSPIGDLSEFEEILTADGTPF